jgi:hypothetical protein
MTPADFTGPSMRRLVQDPVGRSVGRSVWGSVRDSVRGSAQDPVWGASLSQLREPL